VGSLLLKKHATIADMSRAIGEHLQHVSACAWGVRGMKNPRIEEKIARYLGVERESQEIAEATAVSAKRSVLRRAEREGWTRRASSGNGGKQYRYHLPSLPEDVQAGYAASLGLSLDALKTKVKPAPKPAIKCAVSSYKGRTRRVF